MTPHELEEALINEFSTYYLVDDLPRVWNDASIAELARESAERLAHGLSPRDREQLLSQLAQVANERQHRVNREISTSSEIDWAGIDSRWEQFSRLLRAVIQQLRQLD